MRISYDWLKDYIDINIDPEKLAELLTMAGLSVDSIASVNGDPVLEIEITSNRPDWLSYIGVAREIQALTGTKLKIPQLTTQKTKNGVPGSISVKVEDKKLCPLYTARMIKDVKVGQSPEWLRKKIEAMGLRPVNNIVDITNFCLFETGEPMHAFDLDKIAGKKVIIRNAKKGEKIITIDGLERTCDEAVLVIADDDRPIAIAGIMGGLNTEVTFSTKNILLEAAYFDPVSTRRTSRRLGVSTESSYRFERRVDMENVVYSSKRAVDMILASAGGQAGEFFDIGAKIKAKKPVDLRYSQLTKILGIEIEPLRVKKILNSLGIHTKQSSKDRIKAEIPHFRHDIESEIDLIEEVSRIHGYGKVPETIPDIVEQPMRLPFDVLVERRLRDILTGLGMDEIMTYSLLSKKIITGTGCDADSIVEIKNPLTAEQEAMRPSLVAGLLNSVAWNINRKAKDLNLFEIGKVYIKEGKDKFSEKTALSLGMTGQAASSWLGGSRHSNFFDLKGIVEALLSRLGVEGSSLKRSEDGRFSPAARAAIEIKGEVVGVAGEIDKKLLAGFDIKDKVYAAELYMDPILKHVVLEKRFKELPKYPSVFRDISLVAAKEIANTEMMASIKEAAGPLLREVSLIDRYIGGQIPEGKVSLTYRLEYQDLKKTLEDKDISDIHSKILSTLETKFGTKQR